MQHMHMVLSKRHLPFLTEIKISIHTGTIMSVTFSSVHFSSVQSLFDLISPSLSLLLSSRCTVLMIFPELLCCSVCLLALLKHTHTHTHTCMQTSSHSTTTTGAAVKYWGRGEELDPRQYKPHFTVRRFRSDLQCEKRSHLNIC